MTNNGDALMLGFVTRRDNVRSVSIGKNFHCVLTEKGEVEDSRPLNMNHSQKAGPGAQTSSHVSYLHFAAC